MRRARRLGQAGVEFGGSGEDSFVAVVVTKLTGALLFILMMTMVIMALLPKAVDLPSERSMTSAEEASAPLAIATPGRLPEAIAGRPYVLALAATGGRGPLRWAVDGPLPKGLAFDPAKAQLRGTPRAGTPQPVELVLRVSDGTQRAAQAAELVVYETDRPLTTPSRWRPGLPPVPWRAWLEQGFGFLVLALIHGLGLNVVGGLERWSAASVESDEEAAALRRRFARYRATLWLASLGAAAVLALWLWQARA